jgi:hypothetical protein
LYTEKGFKSELEEQTPLGILRVLELLNYLWIRRYSEEHNADSWTIFLVLSLLEN